MLFLYESYRPRIDILNIIWTIASGKGIIRSNLSHQNIDSDCNKSYHWAAS
jgi:hypothetical protein